MKKYLSHAIIVLLLLVSSKITGQKRRIITEKEIWSVVNSNACILEDTSMKINYLISLESVPFYLYFTSIILKNNTNLEIQGGTGKNFNHNIPLNDLKIFLAKKKGDYLVDTITLFNIQHNYDDALRQTFSIKFNISKSDYLYFYSPDFILTEFDISRLRKKILSK